MADDDAKRFEDQPPVPTLQTPLYFAIKNVLNDSTTEEKITVPGYIVKDDTVFSPNIQVDFSDKDKITAINKQAGAEAEADAGEGASGAAKE